MTNGVTNNKIKVGIVGLGLIGASILKKLSQNSLYELFIFSNSSYKKALEYTKNSSNDIKIVSNCDIIFVCTYASKTLSTLELLDKIVNKNTVVADVCSIKKELLNKKFSFNFILSHPMSGTEFFGFESSFSELFENNKWLIEKNNPLLEKIIKDLGSTPIIVDMNKHDELCAQISHLPTILSFLLFDNASKQAKEIASSGFRDATRLAQTNSSLTLSMFRQNLKNIEKDINKIKDKFEEFKNKNDDELIKTFEKISEQRKEMYDKNGKNIYTL